MNQPSTTAPQVSSGGVPIPRWASHDSITGNQPYLAHPGSEFESSLAFSGNLEEASGELLGQPLQFDSLEEELHFFKNRAFQLEQELRLVSNKGKLISQELDLFRQRRVVFWSDRFRNNFDAWNLMNASFQQLKDDSSIFHGDIHRFRLQPSLSLLRVPFLSYNFKLSRGGLRGIWLAPVLDVPLQVGELCVRLFSAPDNLVASCTRLVKHMNCEEPVLFDFDPIKDSDRMDLKMRIYVQGVDAPVRVFELRRYSLGGFGRLKSRPFAAFAF